MIDSARLRMLHAMGIDVYTLRARADAPAPAREQAADSTAHAPTLSVIRAAGMQGDASVSRLCARLPTILGVPANAIAWHDADADGHLPSVLATPVYLVFGSAMARALGAQLSTQQQQSATIAVIGDSTPPGNRAADKRALWGMLKPAARRLHAAKP